MKSVNDHASPRHYLTGEVQRRVSAIRGQLKSEYAEPMAERDKLFKKNEEQSALIEELTGALSLAEDKLADQMQVIARLKNELALERDARSKIEQRIRQARQALVEVDHKFDLPDQGSGGGA